MYDSLRNIDIVLERNKFKCAEDYNDIKKSSLLV